jgi:hypothetical protein
MSCADAPVAAQHSAAASIGKAAWQRPAKIRPGTQSSRGRHLPGVNRAPRDVREI